MALKEKFKGLEKYTLRELVRVESKGVDSRNTDSGSELPHSSPPLILPSLYDYRQFTWPFMLSIYSSVKAGNNSTNCMGLLGNYMDLVLVSISYQ